MLKKIAPIVIVSVSLIIVGASIFGSDADAVDGWKLDPLRTQEVINAHQHDIDELIRSVVALEAEVAKLKKGKR